MKRFLSLCLLVALALPFAASARSWRQDAVTAAPLAYRHRIAGLLSGRIDPWGQDFLLWSDRGPDGEKARQVLQSAVHDRGQIENPVIGYDHVYVRNCGSRVIMTLRLLGSTNSFGAGTKNDAAFTALIHAVRPMRDARVAAMQAVAAAPWPKARNRTTREALHRLTVSEALAPVPFDRDDWQSGILNAALRIEQCQVDLANARWVERQLHHGRLLRATRYSRAGVRAAFELLLAAPDAYAVRARYLPRFYAAVRAGRLDRERYAHAIDEAAVVLGTPQPFGTVLGCADNGSRGIAVIGKAATIAIIDANRVALGLMPFAQSSATMLEICRHTIAI